MKFTATVRHKDVGGTEFQETYDISYVKTQDAAKAYMVRAVEYFNSTLRRGERPRAFVSVVMDGEGDSHEWSKTNLVTLMRGSTSYDTMICLGCSITGKRYGLSAVTLDPAYKAQAFKSCAKSKALLAKRAARYI